MISLDEFIKNTKGKKIDVPWSNGKLKGQCVSLIQQYINQCLNQPMKARGNAKDWIYSYPNEKLGKIVTTKRRGDILVWGSKYGNGYGHIAIYLGNNQIYDQNNLNHDNGYTGIGNIFGNYTILRPNVELIDVDQILNKNDKFTIPGVFKVDAVSKKLDAIASRQLADIPFANYNYIDAKPLIKTDASGNRLQNQVFKTNDYFIVPGIYSVIKNDKKTNAVYTKIGRRKTWIKAGPCYEVN